ncbi:FAD-dependent thymidylate synthase [Candidatus Woesearchaeota archaeon]|nr:FAD-dependent thymidylate synthase [Candidatus Woesearchaeota archaeon]
MESPYGASLTKRLVVPGAETLLYNRREAGQQSHGVTLIEYMGGDAMVERVATAGHGTAIFHKPPSREALLSHLRAKAVWAPFKSVQFKFHIECSIADAFQIVYAPAASVNEYSGRYSVMPETSFVTTAEYLLGRIAGGGESDARDRAKRAAALIQQDRTANYARYQRLVAKDVDLARELARAPLEIDNDTMLFWKMDLHSLIQFIHDKRETVNGDSTLHAYLDTFEAAARAAAPIATHVLLDGSDEYCSLTFPKDEDVMDPTPLPAAWQPAETRRLCVPDLEDVLFQPVKYLDHGAVQAVDYMGGDSSPAESARISYGAGTVRLQEDVKLARFLLKHHHTTPFEHSELAVEGKTPCFVDPRQAARHRTLDFECFMGERLVGSQYYMPPDAEMKHQDRKNRQGRGKDLDDDVRGTARALLQEGYEAKLQLAQHLRGLGVDEETIRRRKGVGFYTFTWRTGDLHNWLNFLDRRWDNHAQAEIREYAGICADFLKRQAPTSLHAFWEYRKKAQIFTLLDQPLIAAFVRHLPDLDMEDLDLFRPLGYVIEETAKTGEKVEKLNREGTELLAKIQDLVALAGEPEAGGQIADIEAVIHRQHAVSFSQQDMVFLAALLRSTAARPGELSIYRALGYTKSKAGELQLTKAGRRLQAKLKALLDIPSESTRPIEDALRP